MPETCDECGFDGAGWSAERAIGELSALEDRWVALFARLDGDGLKRRPAPTTWSALEYGWHTATTLLLNDTILAAVVAGEPFVVPDLSGWPDESGDPVGPPAGYHDGLSAGVVIAAIGAAATRLAARAANAGDGGLGQPMRSTHAGFERMFVDAGITDGLGVLLHPVHDALHHVGDVERIVGGTGTGSA